MHHIGAVDFGRGITPYSSDTPLSDVYMRQTVPDDITRHLVLMEAYDMTYGIWDHERNEKPMGVISMHPAEDMITGSTLKNLVHELVALRLPELTNTPLLELMNYPRWILDDLKEKARKARVKEEDTTRQFEMDLGLDKR